ncbi:Uncharacterised protein [Mycobacterium tuberculosis]|uniref:Uncharacterized protein n=1 Tax=Mycobacterium tuberculosis TaxID=1773 RepID=A0A916LFA1_MYCTX|nr:Uncharacterised protein [Mycobacterium tuberculosis]COZ97692.1 Uncharacterised protein [Mycobacterium tuberculosis]CPB29385.1 Uncharacterised protein [Mycobacterium tuberculosis]
MLLGSLGDRGALLFDLSRIFVWPHWGTILDGDVASAPGQGIDAGE